MGRKPVVSDYGGVSYGRRPTQRLLRKDSVYSFRCLDYESLRYVAPIELTRAARPRCLNCGGPLEETERSQKRHRAHETLIKVVRGEEVGNALPKRSRKKRSVAKVMCEGCGISFLNMHFLFTHLEIHPDCGISWASRGVLRHYKGEIFVEATLYICKISSQKWSVRALSEKGKIAVLGIGDRRHKMDLLFQEIQEKAGFVS